VKQLMGSCWCQGAACGVLRPAVTAHTVCDLYIYMPSSIVFALFGPNACACLSIQIQSPCYTPGIARLTSDNVMHSYSLQGATSKQCTSSSTKQPQSSSSSIPATANGHAHAFETAVGGSQPDSSWQQAAQQAAQESDEAEGVSRQQSGYDSLDYELIENTVYRTDAAGRTHLDHILEGAAKWTICFALGKDLYTERRQQQLGEALNIHAKGGMCCMQLVAARLHPAFTSI